MYGGHQGQGGLGGLESGSSAPTSPITLDTARSQYYQTTFDIETPEMDFVPLESNIARIAGHTYQEQAIVYDPASNREVPEADALSMIDYLLVTVVLEQGLIRSRDRSAVLNLLEFLKDWSGLDDIEAMLGLAGVASAPGAPISPASPSATPANHDNPEATPPLADTAALTIPVIEKYIANAGSIVGAAKNPTYIRLRDTIQQIVRSKKYLMNILKSITFYTIDNYIASFEESIDHLYRDLPVLDPEVQDGIDRILDPMVSEALHTFEMGNRLTLIFEHVFILCGGDIGG